MSQPHTHALQLEFDWLSKVIDCRLRTFFANENCELPMSPELAPGSAYAEVAPVELTERIIFTLALARVAAPATLDPFLIENAALKRQFTEFGGLIQNTETGFIPTVETALFLAAGADLVERANVYRQLYSDSGMIARQLIRLEGTPESSTQTHRLVVPAELVTRLFTGEEPEPAFSAHFPAQRLHTAMDWDDLVLSEHTLSQINHLRAWLEHERTVLDDWGLRKTLAPGYRALFHGPPGTGKTLTAALLGKVTGRPVYRIDLSMVVSKYIGETEKNLARVFDSARIDNWILFFDEADALFGKRTQTSSSNDRYANQEISYLLQRVETSPGLTILATNLRGNIDAAFSRRFQSLVTFTRPDEQERLHLWSGVIDCGVPIDRDVTLTDIASRYSLTGGEIVNVIRYASVLALSTDKNTVTTKDLEIAIAAEQRKEGRGT